MLKVRGEIKNFSTYFDSKQLHCELFSFMGAKLLQISVKKWVPLIHKQTYLTNHETVLMYCTSEQTHKLTSQQTLKKIYIPQNLVSTNMNFSTILKLITCYTCVFHLEVSDSDWKHCVRYNFLVIGRFLC